MCYASDHVTLEIRQQNVLNVAKEVFPTFIPYFNLRVVPMLRMNLETKILTYLGTHHLIPGGGGGGWGGGRKKRKK